MRTGLGVASAAVVTITLLLGLWPYEPLSPKGPRTIPQIRQGVRDFCPANEVSWLETKPGIRLGEHGRIVSESELEASGTASGCAIEIWLEPLKREELATILAISTRKNPIQFQVRQKREELVFWHPSRPPENNTG